MDNIFTLVQTDKGWAVLDGSGVIRDRIDPDLRWLAELHCAEFVTGRRRIVIGRR